MYVFIITLIIIASILLIGVVLIQKSKGGGLASGFSSGNQMMGVRKTTDFIEKATWTLIIVIIALSILSSFIPKGSSEEAQIQQVQQVQETQATPFNTAGETQEQPAATEQEQPAAEQK